MYIIYEQCANTSGAIELPPLTGLAAYKKEYGDAIDREHILNVKKIVEEKIAFLAAKLQALVDER